MSMPTRRILALEVTLYTLFPWRFPLALISSQVNVHCEAFDRSHVWAGPVMFSDFKVAVSFLVPSFSRWTESLCTWRWSVRIDSFNVHGCDILPLISPCFMSDSTVDPITVRLLLLTMSLPTVLSFNVAVVSHDIVLCG